MYAFPRVRTEHLPDFDDERFAYELLEHKHVLVAPGVSFNTPYNDHFRITTLPEPAVIARSSRASRSCCTPGAWRRPDSRRRTPISPREGLTTGANSAEV
jgi:hypothetical protein